MNPAGVFVTGTDTDAGKTVITAGLLRALVHRGLPAVGIKPVQTGCDQAHGPADASWYDRALIGLEARCTPPAQTWLRYRRACSPHLAAEEEGRPIDIALLAARLAACRQQGLVPVVEGAGGVHVPLTASETMLDLMRALELPVLLVAANRLGVINHALLSLDVLRGRGVPVLGVVLNHLAPPGSHTDPLMLADHAVTIARLGGVPVLADVPWLGGLDAADGASARRAWDDMAQILSPVADAVCAPRDGLHDKGLPPQALLDFDRDHLWHPYTSAAAPLPCREAVAASGVRIRLRDGREVIDGMSSWWCAVHGYGHPHLVTAVQRQAARMPHVMFGGLTHEPAVQLGRVLLPMLPAGLEHIFFADSGSVAVEVAIKMAVQYWQAKGRPEKTHCITPRGGYHGDTLGAMSVCDPVTGMHTLFQDILPQQVFVPRPACRFDVPFHPATLDGLEAAIAAAAHRCAAVILEPIVQGAGGMWMYHPNYLRRVRELCDAHELLLICDEIATGFGRTGRLFAVEWADVSPDILCLGKALTGGMMSLAATCASREVAMGVSADGGVFMHGPTFMGNPLACAAATASLELLRTGAWREQVARLEAGLRIGLAPCRDHPDVADVRCLGGIGVVETRNPVDVAALQQFFVDTCGVWIRPFGKLVYLMPPYVSTADDLHALTTAVRRAVHEGYCR